MDEEEAPIPQEDIAPAALPPYDLSGALKESNNTSDNSTLWMQPQPPLPQPQQQDPFAAQNLVAESAKQQAAAVVKNMKSGLDAEVAIPRKLKAIISFAQVLSAFFYRPGRGSKAHRVPPICDGGGIAIPLLFWHDHLRLRAGLRPQGHRSGH